MALKMKTSEGSSDQLNLIGSGTYLEGKIETKGSIRIDGKVKGTVRSSERVTIGSTGQVTGELYAKNAVVGGKIEGDVVIEQKLTLESTSSLNGNVSTGKLIIDEGAFFNGNSQMGGSNKLNLSNNGKKSIFDKDNSKENVGNVQKQGIK